MTRVLSPVSGRVVGLAGVPDPVFAQAMVGPGTAVDPERTPGQAIAPVTGTVVKLHPHAYVVVDDEGHGVLVHLGVDTVQLKGEGFELLAAEGDAVVKGQPLVGWDPAAIEAGGRSPVCAVVALDAAADALSDVRESGEVEKGAELFVWR
ncbi:PTS glucose transporter subunit IIA [Actinomadura rubrobrunea]|uniref:PTS glucose transporter subunit IIA n=1 Tax=Actinomadura rubrobrunea TaxID=115335 RepID=A0A9W6PRP9_9ACTN|nr:PTS glucose transporter subunit IIA [Actinomadura rubrobrunea]MBX6766509.1 PTS glucose transporter subunit IIA [Actinomadura rubrobrunea]GLW61843.1 PTS glucose transporter subunit IIA [Actinomadura rubrobrunea]